MKKSTKEVHSESALLAIVHVGRYESILPTFNASIGEEVYTKGWDGPVSRRVVEVAWMCGMYNLGRTKYKTFRAALADAKKKVAAQTGRAVKVRSYVATIASIRNSFKKGGR